jgi:superfamily I DNA/RNA helicase
MGRQLLVSCLIGEEDERIVKLRLNRLVNYSTLPLYDKKDVFELLDLLQQKGYIELKPIDNKSYIKVLAITKKGEEELKNPKAEVKQKKSFDGYYSNIEKVSDDDRKIFSTLGNFLEGLSDEQKKAVICDSKKILCIAGAGSGKTKVLTNRVWYLSTLKGVDPSKILAITFTRKARHEMIERLAKLIPNNTITIETFNSFCEKILKENEDIIYGKETRVIDYGMKIKLVMKVLEELKLSVDSILNDYYTDKKLFSNEKKTLFFGFVNDIFSVLDYQQNNRIEDEKLYLLIRDYYSSALGTDIINTIKKIKEIKEKNGLRDFTDQITHVNDYFKKTNDIPKYDHILIDEYQDINSLQFELISLLDCENVFAVGDPRQSIYGWRGSKVEYILDFEQSYPGAKILGLSTNYRSSKKIVDVCNSIISPMKLPELISSSISLDGVALVKHEDEDAESIFVAQSILSLDIPRNNIFVLARTNKQVEKLSEHLSSANIKYLKRTIEEMNANKIPSDEEVTLSTIHAIKGLEADCVYIIGANAKNHPCKAQEHPLIEAIKTNDSYDKFAEELRLMYVALSRAKNKLIINYSGSLSSYFDDVTSKIISGNKRNEPSVKEKLYKLNKGSSRLSSTLRDFRRDEATRLSIAPYQVFNDKTLDELCETMPTSFSDLENVNGFGPYKVKKWGEKIIKIIMENG